VVTCVRLIFLLRTCRGARLRSHTGETAPTHFYQQVQSVHVSGLHRQTGPAGLGTVYGTSRGGSIL